MILLLLRETKIKKAVYSTGVGEIGCSLPSCLMLSDASNQNRACLIGRLPI